MNENVCLLNLSLIKLNFISNHLKVMFVKFELKILNFQKNSSLNLNKN